MAFRNRTKNPRSLLPIGTMFAAISALLPLFVHPTNKLWHDLSVGACGILASVSIGIGILSKIRAARQRRFAAS
jgi:hypothetical protein